jgi:PmbA protein
MTLGASEGGRALERDAGDFHQEQELAERLVEEALLAGGVEAEAYLKTSVSSGISLAGRFTSFTGASERGIALRVFDDAGRAGHAFSSSVDARDHPQMIRAALASLRAGGDRKDPPQAPLPAPRASPGEGDPGDLVDSRVTEWSPEKKRKLLESILEEIRRSGSGTVTGSYRDGIARITLATSRGFAGRYERSLSMMSLAVTAENRPTVVSEWVAGGPDPAAMRELASGVARLRPDGPDELVPLADLLLEAPAAIPLVRRLQRDLHEAPSGRAASAGEPAFLKVASEVVTVVDDGRLPGGVATAPFDGEGTATGQTTLVKAGVRIDRLRSRQRGEIGRPGIAVRASYRDLPGPGGTNLFIVPGKRSAREMLSGMSRGYLLGILQSEAREERIDGTATLWRGMGWAVQDGVPTGPCRRILFRAAPRDLLEGILEVSARLHFAFSGGVALGAPDLLIRANG